MKDFLDFELRPLLKDMQSAGVEMGDFEEYLWNRHAEERNRQVAKVNPDMKDGVPGSRPPTPAPIWPVFRLKPRPSTSNWRSGLMQSAAAVKESLSALGWKRRRRSTPGTAPINTTSRCSARMLILATLVQAGVQRARQCHEAGDGFRPQGGRYYRQPDHAARTQHRPGREEPRQQRAARLAVQNPNPEFWQVDQAPKERVVEERPSIP